jgi:hypothetical protein
VNIADQSSVNMAFQLTDCQTYSLFLAFILVVDRSWDGEEWYTTLVHQGSLLKCPRIMQQDMTCFIVLLFCAYYHVGQTHEC